MIHHAMNFGLVVGIYYIAKFCLFPMSLGSSFAGVLFLGLTLVVPFLLYRLTELYRDRYLGGDITFSHALSFATLTIGFGSLLAAAAHYIYFAFIDGGAMVGALEQSVEQLTPLLSATISADSLAVASPMPTDSTAIAENAALAASLNEYISILHTTTAQIKAMTPIDMTLSMLSNNLSWGIIMALPVAALVAMKKRKENKNS